MSRLRQPGSRAPQDDGAPSLAVALAVVAASLACIIVGLLLLIWAGLYGLGLLVIIFGMTVLGRAVLMAVEARRR